ncbi:MAG: YwaF family protein [Clostridia bacterium]|nr:YwaF family protein [Clostridia bacterium]
MYEFLNALLADRKGGVIFSCFGIWHLLYLLIIFGVILSVIFLLKNKRIEVRQRASDVAIGCAFGLYIADFFLMPFAYGEIDLEKLPFHMCTLMCVMCFLSRHNATIGRFKLQFALLGLVSNLIYIFYPAGVEWYQIHPLSYRALQTLLFHGSMSAYGLFVLTLEDVRPEWKKCYKELIIIIAMTLWAGVGNTLYSGTAGDYSRRFNWFFLKQDPLYLLPQALAPYVMPFVMIAVIFAADLLIYAVYFGVKKLLLKKGGRLQDCS